MEGRRSGCLPAWPGLACALALGSLMSLEHLLVLLLAARWGPRRDVFHAITRLVVFVLAC